MTPPDSQAEKAGLPRGLITIRLLPVLLLAAAAIAYIAYVEGDRGYPLRNMIPVAIAVLLALVTLIKGRGRWAGSGYRWLLGTIGYAIPALGLSLYLHYGHEVDLGGMTSQSVYPLELFRYLPVYTAGAGVIGFAIGWLVGRNV